MRRLGELYKETLTAMIGDQALVFDYDADLKDLWEDNSGQPAILTRLQNEQKDRIVVAWDDCSNSSGNKNSHEYQLRRHLTPLDWALAFSIKLLREHAEQGASLRGIHIVDLTGNPHDTWAMSMRHTLLAEMPWVTLHAPLIPYCGDNPVRYRVAYSRILAEEEGKPGLLSIIENEVGKVRLTEYAKPMPSNTATTQSALAILGKQWTACLVQGTDHHNVNNFVGPVILRRLLDPQSPPAGSPLLNAFVQKLNWTNVVSGLAGKHLDQLPQLENSIAAAGIEKVRVLVIDDELERGWDGVVCGLLSKKPCEPARRDQFARLDCENPKESRIQIWGCSTPWVLLDTLGKNSTERFFVRDLQSPLFKGDKDVRDEFLILDLRLFMEAGGQDSRDFIRYLVTKVREWGLFRKDNLAWPPIDESELDSVEAWLKTSASIDPTTEASAITLLPRILALAAPLTPIMLFSSTGRADVKQKLKPYRNILTGFSKPQALQDFAAIRESISEFYYGVLEGIRMLGLRSRLAKCIQVANTLEIKHRENAKALKKNTRNTHGHIDYYFDESGASTQRKFVLASTAAVFGSITEADKLQAYLRRQATDGTGDVPVWNVVKPRNGVLRKPLRKYSLLGHDSKAKRASVSVLDNAITNSQAIAIRNAWTSLCVRQASEDVTKPIDGNIQWTDKHLDLMLSFSVQFNFCILPRFLGFEKVTCNLYFDRRSVPPREISWGNANEWNIEVCNQLKKEATRLRERFGCEITEPPLVGNDLEQNPQGPRKVLVTTYPESAYYPLVREALVSWAPRWNAGISCEVVRGQQLSETSGGYDPGNSNHMKQVDRRRWLHDVADWAAGANRCNEEHLLKVIFPKQLTTRLDIGLVACLKAARSASWARADECIRALMENPRIHDLKGKLDTVEEILIWACRDTLRHASGSSLHVLLSDAESSRPKRSVIVGGDSTHLAERSPVVAEKATFPQKGPGTTETASTSGIDLAVVAEIPADPWAAVVSYRAPQGYEVLEVAGREEIGGQNFWVLRNRVGAEVAVAMVRDEDASTNRKGQIGLFETQTRLVTRGAKGGYYAFSLVHWFGDRSDALRTAGAPDVADTCGQDQSAPLTEDPKIVGEDLPDDMPAKEDAGVSEGQAGIPRQTADWRDLVGVAEGSIEATVFRIDPNDAVVFRSSNANDRCVYSSDEINLPPLLRGGRVLIRPRQGVAAMIGGRIMCALVAWYSSETSSWKMFE